MIARHQYNRQGTLALEPKAFFDFFDAPPARENQEVPGATIVAIKGPLDHHPGWWCDSYDAIKERVRLACEAAAPVIVLKIDSPGGDVSGCFEAAREIRHMAAAAGKTLLAYGDGQVCSGAYALACAASQLVVPPTCCVGSVGVITTRVDLTAYDAKEGFAYLVTASGARKADGHPHTKASEGESAATQTIVDSLADIFFDLVRDLRGVATSHVKALQAGVFYGADAVDKKLADTVMSFDALLEAIANGEFAPGETTMKISKVDDARAALEEAAKSEDEKEAKKAKRALAAMDEDDEEDEESAESEDKEDDKDAESDDEDEDASAEDDKDDKDAKVSAKTAGSLGAMVSTQGKRLAAVEKELESSRRKAFLATRPDLDDSLRKVLANKPLAEVKEIVNAIPKPKTPKPAAAAEVSGTRGASQVGTGAPGGTTNLSGRGADMDEIMGVHKTKRAVVHDGSRTIIGATVPDRKDV